MENNFEKMWTLCERLRNRPNFCTDYDLGLVMDIAKAYGVLPSDVGEALYD